RTGSFRRALCDLEQSRRAHAATYTHRNDDVLHAATLTFEQRMVHQSCARHAVRMADRDSATIDVELRGIDAKLVPAIQRLHCKRLVDLPQADVVDGVAVV